MKVKPNPKGRPGREAGQRTGSNVKKKPLTKQLPFTPDILDKAEKLAFLGMTDKDIHEFFGVSASTWHWWKTQHIELAQRLADARVMALADVAGAMRKAALGYHRKEIRIVAYKGEYVIVPVEVEVGPDTTAGFKILGARAGDNWNPAAKTELTGKDGGPVEVAPVNVYLPDNKRLDGGAK